ncbi:S9 family peptidase [Emticicia fluvialis]|uniref:S9 family peptidase n=1 Tax=Emticicia fluvialis TaxID=2974474 RepID=UPI002165215F|nr:S9 family peptidase [Emticicia fluvialis]
MKKVIALLLLSNAFAVAQKKEFDAKELKADRTPKNFQQPLPLVQWADGDKLSVVQRSAGNKSFVLDLTNGNLTEGTATVSSKIPQPRLSVQVKDNDIFLKDGKTEKQLTKDAAEEKNPTFSPDSSFIAYTKDNNLFTYNLKTNKEVKLTTDGTKTTLNGYATWVYWEEIFGRATRFRAFWWSPDSKKLAYMRFDESKIQMFPLYNSEGQHGFIEETRYPKSGDPNPEAKIGFVSPTGGKTVWADFNEKDEQYFGWPEWLLDGSGLMVQWINRGNDNLKIYNVSPANGSKKEVYAETQKAWIDIDDADNRLTLLDGNKEMIILSDKTGWKQLYLYGIDGKLKNNITNGKFTIKSVEGIDQKNRVVYFHARGLENSARFDFYRVDFDGKNLKRLTFGDYNHRFIQLSPDFKYFITTYSSITAPTSMAVVDNTGKIIKELGSIKGTEMDSYNMAKSELLRVKSDDGLFDLPMTITYPQNMVAGKKYPVLISIYGGPDAGTVFDQWLWSPRTQWYAQEGLIQVSLDHRASGHFGKEGVAYMHRNLGYWEMKDYITLVKSLIDKGIADPTKICITGFSYGGYMSCYALTYGSDVFTHGMAGGSVTDWGLYDSAYTERFMDTPAENPEGYKSSSVMTHVPKYKGMLQIVHGTMDDNVHMQNSIQLIDKLEENKKDFEFMLYPGGRHGWRGNKGQHFDNLKTKFIYRYLLEKPVPEGLLK